MNIELQTPCLKNLLLAFLNGERVTYPPIELTVLNMIPLQVVDNDLNIMELSNIENLVRKSMGRVDAEEIKILLKDWKFVLQRIPSTRDYYFDIEANDLE